MLVLPVDIVWPPDLLRKLAAHAKPIIAPLRLGLLAWQLAFLRCLGVPERGQKIHKVRAGRCTEDAVPNAHGFSGWRQFDFC